MDDFKNSSKEDIQRLRLEKRNKITRAYAIANIAKKAVFAIAILLIIILSFYIVNHTKDDDLYIMNYITSKYNGSFTIVSKEVDSKNNMTYIIKDENGIEFKARKTLNTRTDDYDGYIIKKLIDEYNILKNDSKIEVKDDPFSINNSDFYKVTVNFYFENYLELEDVTRTLFNMYDSVSKEFNKYVKNFYQALFFNLCSNEFIISSYNFIYNDIDIAITEVKRNYISYVMQNNIVDNTLSVEEINSYWNPSNLKIYINDEPIVQSYSSMIGINKSPVTSSYRSSEGKYYINIPKVIEYIPNVSNIEKYTTGRIDGFEYNEKHFEFDGDLKEPKGDKLPYDLNLNDFSRFFNAKITIDFENENLYIQFD